ncbi:transposase family protein [Nonomuraea basaltis]|nr:transposase family protein [Nonomuraea basaltis]
MDRGQRVRRLWSGTRSGRSTRRPGIDAPRQQGGRQGCRTGTRRGRRDPRNRRLAALPGSPGRVGHRVARGRGHHRVSPPHCIYRQTYGHAPSVTARTIVKPAGRPPTLWAGWYGPHLRCRAPPTSWPAARTVGLTGAGVKTFADKGSRGAGGTIRAPFKHHLHRPWLSRGQRDVNRAHARIRAIAERAVATVKYWKVLTKLRCCPHRATALVHATLVLQLVEEGRYPG